MSLRKDTHRQVTLKKELWEELIRIKYDRNFKNLNDVIEDLLVDDLIEFNPGEIV